MVQFAPPDPLRVRAHWWQRRCPGKLQGPLATLHMVWRCNFRWGHSGLCDYDPDHWPELQAVGGWRALRDRTSWILDRDQP